MLVGVSRQSVTKWEAERAYPEMDKLLKMCQIFGCTLDELVQGDLTARPAAPERTVPAESAAAPQDICGYDEFMRGFAFKIATGVALIIGPIGPAVLFGITIANENIAGALATACVLAGVFAGLALIIPAAVSWSNFVKAHPYVEDFYTPQDRAEARQQLAYGLVIGIGIILAAVILLLTQLETTAAVFMPAVAVGVWFIVHRALLLGRTNVAGYNKEAPGELSDDEIDAVLDAELRASLQSAKRTSDLKGSVCGIIMILATIVGLYLLFVAGESVFWMSWVVGGLLCGAASIVVDLIEKR